jgi:hypothetical protein
MEGINVQSFKITWSNPRGAFGWTTLEDCEDMDDAISYWMNHLVGGESVPIDAALDQIQRV